MGEKAYPVGPWSDVFAFGNTALDALFGTVKPGPKHWKQLPDELTEMLARCVDEEFDATNPAEGRFHGFAPILAALSPAPTKSETSSRTEGTTNPESKADKGGVQRVAPPLVEAALVPGAIVERYRHFRDGEFHPGAGSDQGNRWRILKISEAGVLCELVEGNHAGKGPGSGVRFDGSVVYRAKYPNASASQQFLDEYRVCATPRDEVIGLIPEPEAKPPVARRVEPTPGITADPVTEFAEWKAQVAEVTAQAERAAGVFDFARAVTLYAGIPAKRRDEGKLTQWTTKRDRLAAVWGEVESGWKEMREDELVERLEEVLALHPDHPKAKPWLAQFGTAEDRRKAKEASRKAGERMEVALPGGVKMAFAWCPAGKFLMGSPATEKERQDDEQQHEVKLTRGFWMGVHPVTQAQYQAVMGTNPSHFKGDMLPVEQVSWDDAVAFCLTLKQKTWVELRLPTEAEWEYAARGGTVTPFYWGTELNGTQANCDGVNPYGTGTKGPYVGKTTPVGSYAGKYPHPWGLTDMAGNVWEWCSDWYDGGYYAKSETTDPTGPESGSVRVFRGGGWYDFARYCRAAFRDWYSPDYRVGNLGFRLAVVPSGQ